MSRAAARSYGPVAWCYDELAAFYSLGRIAAAKASQVDVLRAGDRVLYAGVGRGRDAVLAARRGARVTALDLSPSMLRRLQRRLARAGVGAETLCEDLLDHSPQAAYDAVAANFVLNVFGDETMRGALAHLASLVTPGGFLMIADFAPPRGGALARGFARAYYRPVSLAAWITGLAARHPIYDYAVHLDALGFEVVRRDGFRLVRGLPVVFESLIARRAS